MGFFRKLIKGLASAAPEGPPPKRNDPCWCGSGKKYKSCHFERDRIQAMGSRGCGSGG